MSSPPVGPAVPGLLVAGTWWPRFIGATVEWFASSLDDAAGQAALLPTCSFPVLCAGRRHPLSRPSPRCVGLSLNRPLAGS